MKGMTGMALLAAGLAFGGTAYEAENATLVNGVSNTAHPTPQNPTIASNASASGGKYVAMNDGGLAFTVTMPSGGFYSIDVTYAQPNDAGGKYQNLEINGTGVGSISFPYSTSFTTVEASSKVKLNAGSNTVSITNSWGWVNVDKIEISEYASTPFAVTPTLVTPNASANAQKVFGFLNEHFQKKIVSGVMTDQVLVNNATVAFDNQLEVAWIKEASGKQPALLGLDFLHGTGMSSTTNTWHQAYTAATLALAKEVWDKGGIATYSWHWKDPFGNVESYKPDTIAKYSTFDFSKAFTDGTYTAWNTSSADYEAIVNDLDIVATYLTTLADQDVPVLWRPLHEAAGKWFWWGADGATATKMLWKLMFDRFVNVHGLDNLIWVWTSDEAADAADWYPGDAYVDIVGRDFYYSPRVVNHSSLTASFDAIKNITNGKKLVTLSECGSVPHPDSLVEDGAGWSYFMPWNRSFTIDTMAEWDGVVYKDNSKAFWNTLMNHDYVLSLDEMPGWDTYVVSAQPARVRTVSSVSYTAHTLQVSAPALVNANIALYNIQGECVSKLHHGPLAAGTHAFSLAGLAPGMYIVRSQLGQDLVSKSIAVE
jgi:mannan endo-1,4-beta-mannosidase